MADGIRRVGITRRDLLRYGGAAALSLAAGKALVACGGEPDEPAVSATPGASPAPGAGAEPTRGGRLRIGVVGGGSSETLSPVAAVHEIDVARLRCLFESLTDLEADGAVYYRLAESMEPSDDAMLWRIRLRSDVVWHDGAPFGADDVVYTLQYILDPDNNAAGAAALGEVLDPQNVRKVDDHSVELTLKRPHSMLPTLLTERDFMIFKDGATDFDEPIGTGPFKFDSWTRGQRSLFTRHDEYREHDGPYLDELEIIAINEATARVNALIGGEIDALAQLDIHLVDQVESADGVVVLDSESGQFTCQYMQMDTPPFDDPRVREALRLAVDREQLVANALSTHGRVANDLPCWFDPAYASDLPQREYDPERARALLAEAGAEDLELTLYASDVSPGMLQSATLIAEQAKEAGVAIQLENTPADEYWSTAYMNVPFASTHWGGRPLAAHLGQAYTSDAPFNETAWLRPEFDDLVADAFRTVDEEARNQVLHDVQEMLWEEGGHIIWGFHNNTDALSEQVHGIESHVSRSLGFYDFNDVYLSDE